MKTDTTKIDVKVEELYNGWMRWHRGEFGIDVDRDKASKILATYEKKLLGLISKLPKKLQKDYDKKMDLFRVWRESAFWLIKGK